MAKRIIKIKKKTTKWVRALKLDHAKAAKLRPTKLGGHLYENVFPQMQILGTRADALWSEARYSGIPVGGGHIDLICRAEAIGAILRALRNSEKLADTRSKGIAAYQITLSQWNSKREWQVHRSLDGAESFVNGILDWIKNYG